MLKRTTFVILPKPEAHVAPRKYPFPMRDIFAEGRKGFRNNSVNPFRPHSDRYREWERGYNHEYFNARRRSIKSLH
jgi:hypothetical protein